jgi:uncharacterized protein YaiI (UPF0178 family)
MNHVVRGDIVITHDIGLAFQSYVQKWFMFYHQREFFEEKDIQTSLELVI